MPKMQTVSFEISTSGRDDGTVEAAYIQLLDEKVHRTREIMEDILLADYTEDGRLIGIEVLAPVKFSDLEQLVDPMGVRESFHRFLKGSAPRELVTA